MMDGTETADVDSNEDEEVTPVTDNRSDMQPQLNDAVGALPEELRRCVAGRLGDVHAADGGLSEESVAGSNPEIAVLNNLANPSPPSRHVAVPSNQTHPSANSRLTDPTDIERFHNDDSTAFSPAVPSSVHVPGQSQAGESTFDEATLEPPSTLTGQYTTEIEVSLLASQQSSGVVSQGSVGRNEKLCLLISFVPAIVLLIALAGLHATTHHDPPKPPGERTQQVLRCASKLSNHGITEKGSPLRWNVAQYFIHGPLRGIDTSECDQENSQFSTLFSIYVLRDSLQVRIPTWNVDSYNHDVCSWTHVRCEENRITHLFLNTVDLSGTLPPEIHWIRSLEWLQICSNAELSGSIPSEVGLLSNLLGLEIQKTSMSGTIPTDLGRLTNFPDFYLYRTQLKGTMPSEICNLPTIESLSADCAGPTPRVSCSCCTKCKQPVGESWEDPNEFTAME